MAKKKEVLTLEEKLEKALVPVSEQPYTVPDNWVWTRLGSVFKMGSGGTPSRKQSEYYTGENLWIKTGELIGRYIYDTEEKITDEAIKNSSAKLFPINTVIIAMYGATIGKIGILGKSATTNQACACFHPQKEIEVLYFFYFAESQKENFIAQGVGGAQPNISQTKLKEHPFPLPPLAEQTRIVSRIESLFSKLDEARELIESSLNRFEERKSAILHKAFSGELTKQWREENGVGFEWEETKLSQISKIVRGGSPRPAGDERFYNGEIPFLKVADLTKNNEKFVFSAQYSIKEAGLKKTRLVPQGTLLLTNSGATLGVPKITQIETTFNDGIAAFLELDDDVEFLFYFLTNQTTAFRSINKGAAQPNLNTDIIGETPIHLPTLPEQQEIVRILDDVLGKESEAKELLNLLEKIDLMKKAILGRAFRGELGTNREDEESAEGLLREVLDAQQ